VTVARRTGGLHPWLAVAALAPTGCVAGRVPDPRDAAAAYALAAQRGDADALYAMMTKSSRESRGKDQVRSLVADERVELADQAKGLTGNDLRVQATARLRFADGEEAALDLHEGRYWITAAGALPGGARTPEEALDQLRRVLARRSYAGLLRLLSPATRAAVENDVRALVEGLGEPATLPVQVTGDAAVVAVPGGHRVKLRREGGVWRIDDFD
jgi:hypothetical protein